MLKQLLIASCLIVVVSTPLSCAVEDTLFVANGVPMCYCFFMRSPGHTFLEAQSVCKEHGYRLPSIPDQETNTFLTTFSLPAWIDLECSTSTGIWQWSDGQPLTYRAFDGNAEPGDCNAARYAILAEGTWREFAAHSRFDAVICSKKADIAETAAADNALVIPEWLIIVLSVVAGVALIAVCILSGLLGFLCVVIKDIFWRRDAIAAAEERIARDAAAAENAETEEQKNDFEIAPKYVILDESKPLGRGAFGRVVEGKVLAKHLPPGHDARWGRSTDAVAVKLLHSTADSASEQAFLSEITIMKMIGVNERIVAMLACVTQSQPRMLILELCQCTLLDHLHSHRPSEQEVDVPEAVSEPQLLKFAAHVAAALEHVSSRGFVHSDVAARNVLLDGNLDAKLADFGLCRRKMAGRRRNELDRGLMLPFPWMAPEAMRDGDFSPASDAWSYGVLLFELASLGETPYAGWAPKEQLERLEKGDRMERPHRCSDVLFELMTSCWAYEPADRPQFEDILKRLAAELSPDGDYIDAVRSGDA